MTTIVHDTYGKSAVRLMKIDRRGDRHRVADLTVSVRLEGEFTAAAVDGDNSNVLPTDTMRNIVYAVGLEHEVEPIEPFALRLARHFLENDATLTAARVEIAATAWQPLTIGDAEHGSAFESPGRELATCAVTATPDGATVESGIDGLTLLKTARSGFVGFRTDAFTTLAEIDDRLLRTVLTARWWYRRHDADVAASRSSVRDALLGAFADHESLSVQHTLYAMADHALAACDALDRIHLVLPNRHCVLMDLSPFGQVNDNRVFVPIEEPFSSIEATISR